MAKIPPSNVPANSDGRAGVFLIIRISTPIGTRKSHGLITNLFSIAESKLFTLSIFWSFSNESPTTKKMISVMIKVGTVVYIMYRICVNKSVPAIAGARFVVSDRGDILSPK